MNAGELKAKIVLDAETAKAKQAVKQASEQMKRDLASLAKAAQTVFGQSGGLFSEGTLGKQPELVKVLQSNQKVMQALANMTKAPVNPFLASFLNQQLGIGAGQNRPNRQSYSSFWQSQIPPFTSKQNAAPPVIPPTFFQRLLRGGNSTLFNPLGLPGVAGGLFAAMTKLHFAFFALGPIVRVVTASLAQLAKSFQQGFDLFVKASTSGFSIGRQFQTQLAARATGLDENAVQSLLLRVQLGNAKGSFEAQRSMRQIGGMSQVFQDIVKWSAIMAREWEKITGELYTFRVRTIQLQSQFDLFWAEIAAGISPALRTMTEALMNIPWHEFGKIIGDVLGTALTHMAEQVKLVTAGFTFLWRFLKQLPQFNLLEVLGIFNQMAASPAYKKGETGIPFAPLPAGHWEKLGLSFGAGVDTQVSLLQRIASNTDKMVKDGITSSTPSGFSASLVYKSGNSP